MRRMLLVTAGALALAGCGGGDGNGGADPLADPTIAKWNAADACALASRGDIGAQLRSPIKNANLFGVETEAGGAQSSRCTITLEDGRTANVNAFKSGTGADEASRKSQRDFITSMAGGEKTVDVDGVGEDAFWSPKLRILWAYFDDSRAVEVSIGRKALPDETLKGDAVALARTAGAA